MRPCACWFALGAIVLAGCASDDDGGGTRDAATAADQGEADPPADGGADPASDPAADPAETGTDFEPGTDLAPDTTPPAFGCAPLPAPGGPIVEVGPDQAAELPGIVAGAVPGTTVLLADGTYVMSGDEASRRIQLNAAGVTLRSASGNPEAVVIDGEYETLEMVTVGASDVVIADLTLSRAAFHHIHVSPVGEANITGVRLYNLRLVDAGEQFVKVNGNGQAWADDGELGCSVLLMTDAGRPHVQREPGGCYTGGIDAHGARGWRVHHNRFEGIYCAGEGLAEHAVHFWTGSRDTVTENNIILNCARGIGYGLIEDGAAREYGDDPYPEVGYIGHWDGIIRNNVVWADIDYHDTGIELAQARGTRVYHNTVVWYGESGFFSSIDARFANTAVDVRNNLTVVLTTRDGAQADLDDNLVDVPASMFVNAAGGDFHLVPDTDAEDGGVVVSDAGVDLDGQTHDRGNGPDIGADER